MTRKKTIIKAQERELEAFRAEAKEIAPFRDIAKHIAENLAKLAVSTDDLERAYFDALQEVEQDHRASLVQRLFDKLPVDEQLKRLDLVFGDEAIAAALEEKRQRALRRLSRELDTDFLRAEASQKRRFEPSQLPAETTFALRFTPVTPSADLTVERVIQAQHVDAGVCRIINDSGCGSGRDIYQDRVDYFSSQFWYEYRHGFTQSRVGQQTSVVFGVLPQNSNLQGKAKLKTFEPVLYLGSCVAYQDQQKTIFRTHANLNTVTVGDLTLE